MMRDLCRRVAVITGAGSGIGRATALALAREGTAVAVCDIDGAAAKDTADAVATTGVRSSVHQVDVSSEELMRELVDAVLREHGVVDVVVNNAGITTPFVPCTDISMDHFRRTMEVNFWGVVYGSLFFLPHLLSRPAANLVNVASNSGIMPYPQVAPYVSSKFAVRGFSETLRLDLRSTPVRVSVVYPGITKTMIAVNSPTLNEQQRKAIERGFDSRLARSPDSVARAIVSAIKKDRPRALIGYDTTVMDTLVRLFPGGYSRLVGRVMDAVTQRFANPT